MLLICYGLPKSASSFAHHLANDIAEAAGHDQSSLRDKYLPKRLVPYEPQPYFVFLQENDTAELVKSLPDDDLLVVKSHGVLRNDTSKLIASGQVKALCTYRDPRDAVVSLFDASFNEVKKPQQLQRESFISIKTLDSAIEVMTNRIKELTPWLNLDAVLKISFEEILAHPFDVGHRIAEYINLRIDTTPICKKYLIDKKRINEFNVGISGRYKTALSLVQEKKCNELFGDLIEKYYQSYRVVDDG